jgi:hypothetical protein
LHSGKLERGGVFCDHEGTRSAELNLNKL